MLQGSEGAYLINGEGLVIINDPNLAGIGKLDHLRFLYINDVVNR